MTWKAGQSREPEEHNVYEHISESQTMRVETTRAPIMTNLDSTLKIRDITLPTKVRQGYGLSSGHVCMLRVGL